MLSSLILVAFSIVGFAAGAMFGYWAFMPPPAECGNPAILWLFMIGMSSGSGFFLGHHVARIVIANRAAQQVRKYGSALRQARKQIEATSLFRAAAHDYTGTELWLDDRNPDKSWRYFWITSREGDEFREVAYVRCSSGLVQQRIFNFKWARSLARF